MRNFLLFLGCLALAASTFGQAMWETNGKHVQLYPTRGSQGPGEAGKAHSGGGGSNNLSYHGGPVLTVATVRAIFWGSYWSSGAGSTNAVQLTNFLGQFGTTGEYNVITQYSGIQKTGLLAATWNDTSDPPTNVTDSALQSEVVKAFDHVGGFDTNSIYEVFLPPGSYSSYGSSDSCGGPHLVYCAYHSNFTYNGQDIKYASLPYPSCSGCQWSGWSAAQNLDHFACHETREAVTDPDGSAWYDRRGNEADDKCAWSPSPFLDGGYGYQYEWSNASSGCVKTLP
jgi:hypothetical protein